MKSIALSAALLLSAVMPLSTAVAAPASAPAAANQSMIEYLGEIDIGGDTYDVYLVTDLGGGWY